MRKVASTLKEVAAWPGGHQVFLKERIMVERVGIAML
jgi:hypothetical protein